MLRQNWAFLLILLFCASMLGITINNILNRDNGIHAAPSKQAVYLQGEACVINMPPERTNIYDLALDFEFCRNKHQEFYP